MTKIKICGLTRSCDIDCVNELAPDYIGFVFAESRRRVTAAQAAALRAKLSPGIIPVGVFVNAPARDVADLLSAGIIDIAQLHGAEDTHYLSDLRRLTDQPVIQAFRVSGETGIGAAQCSAADYILLDSGAGGSGIPFDWQLVKAVRRPYFLAGGLTPDTVRQAIDLLSPFAVDVSSGVETDGKKDFGKMGRFVSAVREGQV